MNYQLLPCNSGKISCFVTHFFTVSSGGPWVERRSMVPTGRQYLLFHLSGSLKYKTSHAQKVCKDSVSLIRVHDFCYSAALSAGSVILGVSLRPNSLHKLFGEAFDGPAFFVSDSRELRGSNELQELHGMLKKQPDTGRRIALLEDYFGSKAEACPSDDMVDDFLARMGDFEQEVSTAEIAQQLCTNQRSLERRFSEITGITPGRYLRLMRFIHLFRDFALQDYPISHLILKYNYIDYSHLSRDFKKYTGVSLKEIHIAPESLYAAYLAASGISFPESV